eukprot:NODE_12_length_45166_cov_0.552511.p12 type:complete len:305 gc:universal NODE_12_length_45166_cov_0.552511:38617-39531(+)
MLLRMGKVMASQIADAYLLELTEQVAKLPLKPVLVGVLANSDPAAATYAKWTSTACKKVGIDFKLIETNKNNLEDEIIALNCQESVNGIMIYYPVFGTSQDHYLQSTISPLKDVEGLCQTFRFNMYNNIRFFDDAQSKKCVLPCTPLAIIKVLEYLRCYNPILPEGDRLHGKTITVINRSEIVGRPLAALLANDGAKVYSVDVSDIQEFSRGVGIKNKIHATQKTPLSLTECLNLSDAVISGVPTKSYKVPTGSLKDGLIAINFSTFQNFEETIAEKASLFVPSVGKVTVAMLQRNLLRLTMYQ